MTFKVSVEFADRFASQWIDAWNNHDIDRILAFYSDDILFVSPMAVSFAGQPSSHIYGKNALRTYWSRCLDVLPDLYFFPPERVIAGEKNVCLIYRGVHELMAVEIMIFNENGLISRSECQYHEPEQINVGARA